MDVKLFFSDVLETKFNDAFSGGAVNFMALYMGTRYPVLQCKRVDTKYGRVVCLTLHEDAEDNIIPEFPQRHYGATITNEDMAATNNHTIQYYLTYKGKSATFNRPMLQMDV